MQGVSLLVCKCMCTAVFMLLKVLHLTLSTVSMLFKVLDLILLRRVENER
jgi:hypothetical protein